MYKTIHECRLDLVAHSAPVYVEGRDDARYDLDFFPASAARVSFGNEDKTGKDPEADRKLMEYLAEHDHLSPFEHQSATFLIECPLFVRSQIMRHRTFAYNEISRRYTAENLEYWVPDTFRKQATNNRQASVADALIDFELEKDMYGMAMGHALQVYEDMIKGGVCREQARAVLPQALLTKFFMTGNLRNWAHFVELRTDGHAQYEVQVVANRISEELNRLWPTAWGVLNGKVRN